MAGHGRDRQTLGQSTPRNPLSPFTEISPDLFIRLDSAGRIVDLFPSNRTILGLAPETVLGGHYLDFVDAEERLRVQQAFELLLSGTPSMDFFLQLLRRSGQPIWAKVHAAPWFDGEHIAGVQGVIRNISGREPWGEFGYQEHNEAANLRVSRRQLIQSERLSAIGSLTASIVHEFNNPLCGVRTVLERMTRNPDLMDADRELLRLALANCDRMSRLLRDLQQFNRPFSDERRDFDLHRAIDSVLLLLNKHLQRHKAVLIQDYGSAPLLLHGAEDQIKQVLLHLIKTRAEALPETGGEIRIQTMREDGQVRIIFSEATNGVDPAPPSAQRSVPMFTCRTLRQEPSLALAVSYSIVKAHGGEILVAFPPETGVAHTLILPAETNGIAR